MINVKKRKKESDAALVARFTRKMARAGVIKETQKHRYRRRSPNDTNVKASKLHRLDKQIEYQKKRKLGLI